MADGIFAGLKVIDCASWIAGPAAATILSDFGAEVIKIEPPGAGDPWRASAPVPGKVTDYWWQLTSRNKRSLAIDLKHPEGLAVLHRLIGSTDVFITNFPLPVRERLKIAAADLLAINPRLVYGSITAYGEAGAEAARTGFDATAYWARTGLMDMVRATPETEPVRSMPGMGDHPTATALYAAIVTALYRREKTGRGGVAQTSLLQNGLWANGCYRAEPPVRRARPAPAAAQRDAERAGQPLSLPRRPLVPDGAAQRGAPARELPEGDRRRASRARIRASPRSPIAPRERTRR